jgi:mannose-6-phosphate isomerase-like protein (cupin superfamily)
MMWATRAKSDAPDVIAPDGSEVRLLATSPRASMAHFQLPPGAVSKPMAHRTVEELWYIVAGRGRMWRERDGEEQIVDLKPGLSLSIPVGAKFQFRCDGDEPLQAVGTTIPAWPGMEEAYAVTGKW